MKCFQLIFLLFFIQSIYCQDTDELLMPWLTNSKFEFCDSNGVQKIPARFDYVEPFNMNHAIVGNNGKLGVIDGTGRLVVPTSFRKITYMPYYKIGNEYSPYGMCFSVNDDSVFFYSDGIRRSDIPENVELSVVSEANEEDWCQIYNNNGKLGYIEFGDTTIHAQYIYLSRPYRGYSIFIASKDGANFGIITSDNFQMVPFEYTSITLDDETHVLVLTKKDDPNPCYYVFRGSNIVNPVNCGYKKLIRNFYDFLLVEDPENRVFFVNTKNGKVLRK